MNNLCCRRRPTEAPSKPLVKPSVENHRRRGKEAFSAQDYDRAIAAYSDALDLDPTDASLWVNRSIAHRHASAWASAISDADRALEIEPFNDKAIYSKCLALQRSGKCPEALQVVGGALTTDPDNSIFLQLRRTLEREPQPKQQKRAETKAKAAPRDSAIDYSKWKNIVDSDDEKEEPEYKLAADGDVLETGGPVAGHLSREKRSELIEEMINVVRKLLKENSSQLNSVSSLAQKKMLPALGDNASVDTSRLPADYGEPVGTLSLSQLSKYSCSSARMLTSVYGRIYDVSSRPDDYGNGAKSWYSGHDITWALLVGTPSMKNVDRFYDVFKVRSEEQLTRLLRLIAFFIISYEDNFKQVGELDKFEKEMDLPEPPTKEVEACPTM